MPGVVLAAAYLLWLYQRVFFGTVTNPKNEKLHDLTPREVLTFVPLLIMAFWIGLYPKPFFQILEQPVNQIVQNVHAPRAGDAVNAAVQPEMTPSAIASSAAVTAAADQAADAAIDEREELVGVLSQFTASDYLLALPITLLTVFALGILLIDLMLPAEEKWVNALLAFVGVLFAARGVCDDSALDASESVGVHGFARHDGHHAGGPLRSLFLLFVPCGHSHFDSHLGAVHEDRT